MKHALWIFLLIIGATACKSDGGSAAGAAQGAPQAGVAATAEPQGGFVPPQNPGTSPLVALLTNEFWVFEFYVVDDPDARKFNRGRWFRLKSDGTFTNGHWQEQTGYGSWRLEEAEGKMILHVDNIYDSQDAQYEVQAISQEQDAMTWIGVNRTPTAGIIIKAINLSSRPTKAQFNIED